MGRLILLFLTCVIGFLIVPCYSSAHGYEPGKHYQQLKPSLRQQKTIQDFIAQDPHKVQVIEFFNYGCFGCAHLHPIIEKWAASQSTKVAFYRFPVVFHKQWEILAKSYYLLKKTGKLKKIDPLMFEALHQKHINLSDEKILRKFLVDHGVSEKEFGLLMDSFSINAELAKGIALANAYQIIVSPVLVVNTPAGSYLLSVPMAGSAEKLIDLLNILITGTQTKKI